MAVTLLDQKQKDILPEQSDAGAWVALIYLPQKEHQPPDSYDALMNPRLLDRPLVHTFAFQMPPTSQGKDLPANFIPGFMLRPGCNLQVTSEQWAFAVKDIVVQHRLSLGAIEVVNSTSNDSSSPGYRHFDDKTVINLVRKTEDIDSISTWLVGETRSLVIEAAKNKKAAIESELAKRAA
jgi:hypothetical protein